jgi:phosphocarrier protein
MFVQTANAYASKLRVGRTDNDERVDGKSIMGMMMLAAERGVELELEATGADAEQQLRALAELVAARFGED